MSNLARKALELTKQYGLAWVVVNQSLGWLTYFLIVFILTFTNFDISTFLKPFGISYDFGYLSSWGLAIVLNRFLTPLRIVVTTSLMPFTASPINSVVNPIVNKIWPGNVTEEDSSFPGIEETETEKNK